MIYAMQPVGGGAVKLGYSADVESRHRQLEAHYRQPLAVLAVLEGDRQAEREIHARFAHLRFGKTEQFKPAPDLMEFIERPLLADLNPGAVEAMCPPFTSIRMADDVIADAKVVASLRDITMAELLSDTLRPILKKALETELRKRIEGDKR